MDHMVNACLNQSLNQGLNPNQSLNQGLNSKPGSMFIDDTSQNQEKFHGSVFSYHWSFINSSLQLGMNDKA